MKVSKYLNVLQLKYILPKELIKLYYLWPKTEKIMNFLQNFSSQWYKE